MSFATLACLLLAAAPVTPWEAGGGNRTPRHAETVAFCRELAAAYPGQLRYTTFGTSPEGRELPLLIADAAGRFTPPAARPDAARAVVLIQACIHAGECCGKDAGLVLLRDLARDGALPPDVTILFVPIFNVDGHERFTPYGRINQNGPEAMGWRTTARNLNLNRDYLKADTPEMRAWLRLWNDWLPDVLVDTHATDGADYQYAMTYLLDLGPNVDPDVAAWNAGLLTALDGTGVAIAPYASFVDWRDPHSGLRGGASEPRFSQGYAVVQNRPGLLLEAHVLKPYPERVRATLAMLRAVVGHAQREHAALAAAVGAADARAAGASLRESPLPLSWQLSGRADRFRFLGVAADEVVSEISGGTYFRFHPDRPETFIIDWQREIVPQVTVDPPEAYLVPPAWDDVIARLEAHGVAVRRLTAPAEVTVRSYRLGAPSWQAEPYEGRHPLTCTATTLTERRTFPAGTAVVDLAQRASRVAINLLEPQGPDSFVRWGFFDPVFTPVEYAEDYVLEPMMAAMVAADPALADSARALGDPAAIRRWFYARTPYHDQRHLIYPVGLLDDRASLNAILTGS